MKKIKFVIGVILADLVLLILVQMLATSAVQLSTGSVEESSLLYPLYSAKVQFKLGPIVPFILPATVERIDLLLLPLIIIALAFVVFCLSKNDNSPWKLRLLNLPAIFLLTLLWSGLMFALGDMHAYVALPYFIADMIVALFSYALLVLLSYILQKKR
jgi:hypothetical protein